MSGLSLLASAGQVLSFDRLRVPVGLGAALVVALTACALLFAEDRKRGGVWSRRWIGAASPEALAAMRVVVLGVVIVMVVREDLPSTASIPRSMLELRGKGVMSLLGRLPGYPALVASYPALLGFKLLLLVLLALGLVGWRSRVVLPLCFAGYLLFGGVMRQYVHFFHQGLLPLYLLLVLAVVPCADAWSLDRLRRRRRGLAVPPAGVAAAAYGFGRWALFALIGLSYFSAGLSKLRLGGFFWWEAANMRSKILVAALEPKLGLPFGVPLAWQPDWVLAALGLGTLLIELAMIGVLFGARLRLLLAPALFLMHAGVLVAQEILFIDLLLLPLVLVQPHHLARAVAAVAGGRRGEARAHLRAVLAESGFGPAPERAPSPAQPLAAGAGPRRLPLHLVYGVAAYVPFLVFVVEWYPITAWQMYAYRFPSSEIAYLDVQELRADGSLAAPSVEREIGALIDRRYHEALWSHFTGGEAASREHLDELFQAVMDRRNARSPAGGQITGFVVEHRRWDWREAPSNPRQGRMLARYVYPAALADENPALAPHPR